MVNWSREAVDKRARARHDAMRRSGGRRDERGTGVDGDRWDALFEDLEAEAAAQEAADLRAEVTERTRRELGSLRLIDRLRGAGGRTLHVDLRSGEVVTGLLADVGADWLLIRDGAGAALVALAQVISLRGLGPESATPGSEGRVGAALDLRHPLRRLCRSRVAVLMTTAGGATVAGTIDRVGADFVDVAQHPPDVPRRADMRQIRTIPVAAIALVRSS